MASVTKPLFTRPFVDKSGIEADIEGISYHIKSFGFSVEALFINCSRFCEQYKPISVDSVNPQEGTVTDSVNSANPFL